MAITYYYPNGNDGGWVVSTNTNCDDGFNPGNGLDNDVTGPNDATFITCDNQAADVLNLDTGVGSGEHAIIDGDTITQVRIKVRATLNASDSDNNIEVDLIIGGVAQGVQQETGHLTGSFVTYTLSDTGWDSDWTAAQIAGMQVRLTSEQGGMPSSYDVDVSEVEVEVTYTEASSDVTELPLLGELDFGTAGLEPAAIIANTREPAIDALVLDGKLPISTVGITREPDTVALDIAETTPLAPVANTREPATDALVITGNTPIRSEIDVPAGAINIWKYVGLKLDGHPPTATVSGGGNITEEPTLGTLTIDEKTPITVVNNIPVPDKDTLTLTGYIPTVVVGEVELPDADALVLDGKVPTVSVAHLATPDVGTLTIDEKQADRTVGQVREPAIDELVLDGKTPVVIHDRLADVPEDTLVLSGKVPTLQRADVIEVPEDTLVLSGKVPTIGAAGQITVPKDTLSLTGYAPTAVVVSTAEPDKDTLTLSGLVPITVVGNVAAPDKDTLTLDGKVPTLGGAKVIEVPEDTLALSGIAPSAIVANVTEPGADTLVLSGKVPTLAGDAIEIEIPTGVLNIWQYVGLKLDGYPPTTEIDKSITLPVGSLLLSGNIPTLSVTVAPTVGALTLSGKTPILNQTVSVGVGSLTLQGREIVNQDSVLVTTGSLTLTGQAPNLKEVEAPGTGSLTLTGYAPTANYEQSPDVGLGTLTLAGAAPTVVVSVVIELQVGALTFNADPAQVGIDSIIVFNDKLVLAGQAPESLTKAFPEVGSDSVTLGGNTPTTKISDAPQTVTPGTASLILESRIATVGPLAGTLSLTGQSVSIFYRDGVLIENPDATTSVPSNYEQCDFTGFRQLPGSLKLTWNKHAVRKKSWEERHPQDTLQSVPERQKGSRRPEQADRFIEDIGTVEPDDL